MSGVERDSLSPADSPTAQPPRVLRSIWLWWGWALLGGVLVAAALSLNFASQAFGYETALEDMPALALALGLGVAGSIYLLLVPLLATSLAHGMGQNRGLLALVFVVGAAMRLSLFGSEPLFEDDWYRYLWDGGVAAHGYNPYAVSPDEAQGEPFHYTLQALARSSVGVIERINHSDVTTIYPPVAIAGFSLAHIIAPWSLEAWRAVCLAGEVATFGLLVLLLQSVGRAPVSVALYWWSPLAAKEMINSAHMEALLLPLVLGALVLAVKQRTLAAVAVLGLGIGTKIWPVLLAPLLLRPLLEQPKRLLVALGVLAGLSALWAWPIVAGGLDESSGFAVYAEHWRNSSALFGGLEQLASAVMVWSEPGSLWPGRVVRALLALTTFGVAISIARGPIAGAGDLIGRAGLVIGVLFLLSPSQFPWYALWVLPFAVFQPWLWLLALALAMPLYYVSFYYAGLDAYAVYRDGVVWLMWLPVWTLLVWEARRVTSGQGLVLEAWMEEGRRA